MRMVLDEKGQAVFFTRRGKMLGSVPPPVNEPKLTPALPPAPQLRLGQMYNGAARLADGAVPWAIEAAAVEAVDEALGGEAPVPEGEKPAPGSRPAFPRKKPRHEHVAMGQAATVGQANPEEVNNDAAGESRKTEDNGKRETSEGGRARAA